MRFVLPVVAFFLLTGHSCHDHIDDDPSRLPPGDAVGDAYGGSYEWEVLTLQCDGDCQTDCLIGTASAAAVALVQDDGYLETSGGFDLRGGIDRGGGFDIGGASAETTVTRAQGSIDDGGEISGSVYRSYRDGACIEVARLLGSGGP